MRKPLLFFLLLVFAAPLRANTIYSYTGNPFGSLFMDSVVIPGTYSAQNRVTLSFELDRTLGPNASFDLLAQSGPTIPHLFHYTISDGRNTLTDQISGLQQLQITTDGNGKPSLWSIEAQWTVLISSTLNDRNSISSIRSGPGVSQNSDIGSILRTDNSTGLRFLDQGAIGGSPGTWVVAEAPETSSLSLLTLGLFGLYWLRQKASVRS